MGGKSKQVFYGGEQVTKKDLDIISICTIRCGNCNGCICKDVPAGIIKETDRRFKGCAYLKEKFKVNKPNQMENCLY